VGYQSTARKTLVITRKDPKYGRLLATDNRIFLAGDYWVPTGIHDMVFQF
jgi:hypothetical protein